MPFLLLLVLTLICLQREWPEPLHDGGLEGTLLFTWGGVAAFVVAAWLLALRARLGFVLAWAVSSDTERAAPDTAPFADDPSPRRWTYVGLQARHNLLLIAPPLLLMLVQQAVLALFPQLQHDELLLPIFGAVL